MGIKINEVFNSISGEVSIYGQGRLCTFVRFSGCVAECRWCDTNHNSFSHVQIPLLIEMINPFYKKTNHLCVTGGEPLMQPDAVFALAAAFPQTWIETSGLVSFTDFIGKIPLVVDYKINPEMKQYHHNESDILDYAKLKVQDCIKIIIEDRRTMLDAVNVYQFLKAKGCEASIAFAPIHGEVTGKELLDWMYEFGITDAILNVQLHKYIGLK